MNWVEIDVAALQHNVRSFEKHLRGKTIAPVIKSNAYGHGMELVARALRDHVQWFCVANTTEALALRSAGVSQRILVLSYLNPDHLEECILQGIDVVVHDKASWKSVCKMAVKAGKSVSVHLKLDCGTTRIGFRSEDDRWLASCFKSNRAVIQGVFSHFSSSEEHEARTHKQYNEFVQRIHELPRVPPIVHMGCSAAAITLPLPETSMVRLGLSAYGLWPSKRAEIMAPFSIKPVLSWYTRLIQVKRVPAGTGVGYGASYTAKRAMTVGVLAAGYNEGLPRSIASSGKVILRGRRAPIIGRICMNLSMIDLTRVPSARTGDPVILLGRAGNARITAEDHATWTNTINYEVVTRINPTLPRQAI